MKVKVTGTIQEGTELKIITVRTLEVVDEYDRKACKL